MSEPRTSWLATPAEGAVIKARAGHKTEDERHGQINDEASKILGALRAALPGRRLTLVLKGQASEAFPEGDL